MTRNPLRLLLAMVLAALCAFAVACGGDDESAGSEDAGQTAQQDGASNGQGGQRGGRLTELSASDVDYVDPGRTYYQPGLQLAAATGRPLYNFRPGEDNPVADLAEGQPQISDDAKTVTVRIRKGVRFAPPVNREVTAEDVKYAMERGFTENVGNQYTFYFEQLVGAPEEPTKRVEDIEGIEVTDPHTIVFRLQQAAAAPFAAALTLPLTAPVPEEYARRFDRKNPSTYNENVVSSGPYMIRNNAQGELVGYRPGRQYELVRNPNWQAKTDFRPAYLDEILVRTNASDANVAGRQVLQGQGLTLAAQPPAPILARVVRNRQQREANLTQVPGGGVRYFSMNTRLKPFDDINVRKAVIAGFDRTAARLARGGEFVGPIAQHFIPVGMPGFEESGGEAGFKEFDWMQNPKGNLQLAQDYMRKAGYESGRYDGNEEILIVTANADPGRAQAQVAQAQLEKLGFKVRLRQVPQDAVYTEWCQRPDRDVHMCGSAGWFKDFNDPQSMLEPLFKGSSINQSGGNNNLSELDVPEIDRAMDAAVSTTGEERNKAWAEINRLVVAQAPNVPFVWDAESRVHSSDVVGVQNAYWGGFDYSFTSLKR
jgi:peptide/nickel transport system substrate-binding protein